MEERVGGGEAEREGRGRERSEVLVGLLIILKVGEHEEFFIRFSLGKYRAAYCASVYVENQQDKCNEVWPLYCFHFSFLFHFFLVFLFCVLLGLASVD